MHLRACLLSSRSNAPDVPLGRGRSIIASSRRFLLDPEDNSIATLIWKASCLGSQDARGKILRSEMGKKSVKYQEIGTNEKANRPSDLQIQEYIDSASIERKSLTQTVLRARVRTSPLHNQIVQIVQRSILKGELAVSGSVRITSTHAYTAQKRYAIMRQMGNPNINCVIRQKFKSAVSQRNQISRASQVRNNPNP